MDPAYDSGVEQSPPGDSWCVPRECNLPGLEEQARALLWRRPSDMHDAQPSDDGRPVVFSSGIRATRLHLVKDVPYRERSPEETYVFLSGRPAPPSPSASSVYSDDTELSTAPSSLVSIPRSPGLAPCSLEPDDVFADICGTPDSTRPASPEPPGELTVQLVPRAGMAVPLTVISGFGLLAVPMERGTIERILRVLKHHTGCRGKIVGPLPGHPAVDPEAGGYLIELIGDYCNVVLVQTLVAFDVPEEHISVIKSLGP